MSLVEKIRKSRESNVTVCGYRFTIRRPTDYQFYKLCSGSSPDPLSIIRLGVVGWNLTELDLYPGGTGEAAAFDIDVLQEWIEDKPQLWPELANAIIGVYNAYKEKSEETLGKSDAG